MPIHLGSPTIIAATAADSSTPTPIPEEEEFYSSWSLFLVCLLLILSLWTSYYLQIKRIRAIHETVVSIIAGMVVGFTVRLAPGHLIREMLVSMSIASAASFFFLSFFCVWWAAGDSPLDMRVGEGKGNLATSGFLLPVVVSRFPRFLTMC
jgi:hypothetical protein